MTNKKKNTEILTSTLKNASSLLATTANSDIQKSSLLSSKQKMA